MVLYNKAKLNGIEGGKMKKLLLILTLLIAMGLSRVNNYDGTPYSYSNNINQTITYETMPSFDSQAMLDEDEETRGVGIPLRYAKIFEVNLGIEDKGSWTFNDQGDAIWTMGIESRDAYAMKFLFDDNSPNVKIKDDNHTYNYEIKLLFIKIFDKKIIYEIIK